MNNVTHLVVTQFRVFPPDVLPMRPLMTKLGMEALQTLYSFRAAGLNEVDVRFEGGSIRRSEVMPIWINWLTINERRIALQVLGDSSDALEAYAAVMAALVPYSPGIEGAEPLILAEETACSVELEFDWHDLLAAQMPEFVATLLDSLKGPGLSPFLKATSLRFQVGFQVSDDLEQYGVTVAEKMFVIEPRADIPLHERRYYSSSPTSSDSHFKLLQELETKVRVRAETSAKIQKRKKGA